MKLYTMVIESFGVLVTGKFFLTQVQIIKPVVIRSLGHLVFWVIMFYIFCFCVRRYVWSLSHLVFWSLVNIQAKKYKFEKNKPVVIRSLGHLVFWMIMFYTFLFFRWWNCTLWSLSHLVFWSQAIFFKTQVIKPVVIRSFGDLGHYQIFKVT